MSEIGHFLLLWIVYALSWFLLNFLISLARRNPRQMTLPMAFVLGLLSACLHVSICFLVRNGFCIT